MEQLLLSGLAFVQPLFRVAEKGVICPGLLNVDVARSQTQQLGHKLFVVLIEAYVPAFGHAPVNPSMAPLIAYVRQRANDG